MYREVIKKWSNKDYTLMTGLAPDQHFFNTFRYFYKIAKYSSEQGLKLLKNLAIQENIQYLETIMDPAPSLLLPDIEFEEKINSSMHDETEINKLFINFTESLKKTYN